MTDFIFWVLFGILAAWIVTILTDTRGRQRVLGTMATGILGALTGGALMRFMNERGIAGFSIPSLLTAVCGAIVLLTLVRITNREK